MQMPPANADTFLGTNSKGATCSRGGGSLQSCFVPLTQGKYAVIDEVDQGRVMKHKWHARHDGNGHYAARKIRRGGKPHVLYLHRFILGATTAQQIDHVNGDGLDCRRNNLRICDHSQNQANRRQQAGSSRFRGVYRSAGSRRWYASIKVAGKGIALGGYDDEVAAARAYDVAARKHFGEFAKPNFVRKVLSPPAPAGQDRNRNPRGLIVLSVRFGRGGGSSVSEPAASFLLAFALAGRPARACSDCYGYSGAFTRGPAY